MLETLTADCKPEQVEWIKAVVFVLCLIPVARLAWLALHHGLGANPIEYITRSTGWWTLTFLLITLIGDAAAAPDQLELAVAAAAHAGAVRVLLRRACTSPSTSGSISSSTGTGIVKDIGKRPFITVGFAAFVLLIPLAATSTNAMVHSAWAHAAGSCCIGWSMSIATLRRSALLVAGEEGHHRAADLRRAARRAAAAHGPLCVCAQGRPRRRPSSARSQTI